MLLFKVGKPVHLESLKKGIIHFQPLSYYRNDSTAFRGDLFEGTYVLGSDNDILVDGVPIPSFGSNIHIRAILTYIDSDNTLTFCASMLNEKSSHILEPGRLELNDSFLSQMRQFGSYAIVFDSIQFVQNITNALNGKKCNCSWGPVSYCEKNNHDSMQVGLKGIKSKSDGTEIYFVKDNSYRLQNEWRFVINYISPSSPLKRNEDGSCDIEIEPILMSDIIDLSVREKVRLREAAIPCPTSPPTKPNNSNPLPPLP